MKTRAREGSKDLMGFSLMRVGELPEKKSFVVAVRSRLHLHSIEEKKEALRTDSQDRMTRCDNQKDKQKRNRVFPCFGIL